MPLIYEIYKRSGIEALQNTSGGCFLTENTVATGIFSNTFHFRLQEKHVKRIKLGIILMQKLFINVVIVPKN